jgi:uncharacterized protein YneF (UPF0154 family)
MSTEQVIQALWLVIAVLVGYCIGLYDAFRIIRKHMKTKK